MALEQVLASTISPTMSTTTPIAYPKTKPIPMPMPRPIALLDRAGVYREVRPLLPEVRVRLELLEALRLKAYDLGSIHQPLPSQLSD